jgi:hypothetical protein
VSVTVSEPQCVTEERAGVLVIKGTDERLIRRPLRPRHIR